MDFNDAELGTTAYTPEQIPAPKARAEIVFSGRSNVGKSSLLNRLFSRKALARVSSAPGKTASVNFYRCGGIDYIDLPGYGFARVSAAEREKWGMLVERYFGMQRPVALVVQLLDVRHAPSGDDCQMIDFLREKDIPFVAALTKCDKLKKIALEKKLAEWKKEGSLAGAVQVLPVSSEKGEGMDALKAAILSALHEPRV